MGSPLLDNWRIIISLRDTGIEVLRNWLGKFLDALKLETLSVDLLSEEDAEILAEAKPKAERTRQEQIALSGGFFRKKRSARFVFRNA